MDTPLSAYYRQRIVTLWKQGENISAIVRILRAEGWETMWGTVRKWIFRWQEQLGLQDKHRSGRFPKINREIAITWTSSWAKMTNYLQLNCSTW